MSVPSLNTLISRIDHFTSLPFFMGGGGGGIGNLGKYLVPYATVQGFSSKF